MTRKACWFFMSAGGFALVGLGVGTFDAAVACSYFGGLGLLLHWAFN